MLKTKLDNIDKLGFNTELKWNNSFFITYNVKILGVALYPLIILKCDINSKEFDDIIRMCYDIFYEWYKSNSTLLNKVDLDDSEIENIAIGDVTKSVMRELNLIKLL
jgi:hypothetical protein